MGDLVMRALLQTFQDMLGIKLANIDLKKAEFPFDMHVLSEMEFSGQTRGKIYMHVDQRSARRLVSQMLLGTIPPEAATGEQIDLTLSELTNIVVGNFLSTLSDAGLHSQISAPKIGRSADSRLNAVSGGVAERLAFRSPELSLLLDISIDPWNE
jgi:CheY-specific phosphatase CheX